MVKKRKPVLVVCRLARGKEPSAREQNSLSSIPGNQDRRGKEPSPRTSAPASSFSLNSSHRGEDRQSGEPRLQLGKSRETQIQILQQSWLLQNPEATGSEVPPSSTVPGSRRGGDGRTRCLLRVSLKSALPQARRCPCSQARGAHHCRALLMKHVAAVC